MITPKTQMKPSASSSVKKSHSLSGKKPTELEHTYERKRKNVPIASPEELIETTSDSSSEDLHHELKKKGIKDPKNYTDEESPKSDDINPSSSKENEKEEEETEVKETDEEEIEETEEEKESSSEEELHQVEKASIKGESPTVPEKVTTQSPSSPSFTFSPSPPLKSQPSLTPTLVHASI